MAEARALALDVETHDDAAGVDELEVVFDDAGDLGISIAVDGEGSVVVSKLLQLRGYGELSCPTLHAGDVLVTIDEVPITEWSFADVMQKLHATVATRPTRLEFLGVDRFDSADSAVAKWQKGQTYVARDEDPRLREGEFEVTFAPQQPTGLRFSESYIMTTPLKLAYVETALLTAMGFRTRDDRGSSRDALVNTLLVRIEEDSVLGAPVDDVMALLYDAESFPKTLWLAQPDRLQQDYQVVTLTARDQLKWFCFVPVEMMMEVAVVSYAALATTNTGTEAASSSSPASRRRTRSDGICEHQYLMAINGFPTLRVSSSSNFSDDDKSTSALSDDDGVVAIVNQSLDELLGSHRTLRFRDLKAYRREYLAHAPLSPWQRRRRTRASTSDSSRTTSTSSSTSPIAGSETLKPQGKLVSQFMLSLDTPDNDLPVHIERKPLSFFQIIQSQSHVNPDAVSDSPDDTASTNGATEPPIKRYHGLANCEGVRSFTPVVSDNVKCVVVPDNRRPVGIQLETDVMLSGRPVFKSFLRTDGPALLSQNINIGDRILSVNGVSVEEIPTDVLVRILHGEDVSLHRSVPTAPSSPAPMETKGRKKENLAAPSRHRVLRLAKGTGTHSSSGLMGQARKLLALSKARLALWKSSQNNRSSVVH